jgi:anti-sigma B factor antagonist
MGIEVIRIGRVTVASLKGDLTAMSASETRQTLTRLVTPRRNHMVLDLANVTYLDSSGLAVIVETMKRARTLGGDLKVCMLQPDVRSIFDMTRLTAVFDVHPSRDEAVVSCA